MAELLIYDKEHWMDALTVAEVTERVNENSKFQIKYDARYQRGDIVEIRPDGFWTGGNARGFNKEAFRVISVGGISVKDAHYLIDSSSTKKRIYSTSLGEGKDIHMASNLAELSIINKT